MRAFWNTTAAAAIAVLSTGAAQAATTGFDVLFMMDSSGSLRQAGFDEGKAFVGTAVQNYIDPSNSDNRVAMSLFATGVFPTFGFSDPEATDTTQAVNAVNSLTFTRGATWTKSAILGDPGKAETNGIIPTFAASGSTMQKKVAFLITDGNPAPTRTQSVCGSSDTVKQSLDATDITLYIIGIGANWDPAQLSCLVDDPDSQIFAVDDFGSADADLIFTTALDPTPVPLPASLPLLAFGAGLLALMRRRKQQAA